MFPKLGKLSLPVLAGALLLGGCESLVGSNQGDETRIVLTRSGSASASLAPAFYAAVASAMPPVALDQIASIDITLTKVQALPQGGDEDAEDAGWVTLDLTAPATVNFLSLPTDAATGGLEIARGDLPEGTYGNLRLLYSAATITFKEPVTVGRVTYPANEAIPLTIPSGKESGIKVPTASFTVTAESGTTIKVVFDAAASVRKIIATGADKIIMPPVLTAGESED